MANLYESPEDTLTPGFVYDESRRYSHRLFLVGDVKGEVSVISFELDDSWQDAADVPDSIQATVQKMSYLSREQQQHILDNAVACVQRHDSTVWDEAAQAAIKKVISRHGVTF